MTRQCIKIYYIRRNYDITKKFYEDNKKNQKLVNEDENDLKAYNEKQTENRKNDLDLIEKNYTNYIEVIF